MEKTITIPDTQAMSKESRGLVIDARGILEIKTDIEYEAAGALLPKLASAHRFITAAFEPARKAADAAKKSILALRDSFTDPLEAERGRLGRIMAAYAAEREKAAKAAAARLAAAQKERADDAKLEVAEALEAEGRHDAAEAVLASPTPAAIVAVAGTPEVEGVSYRENWSAELVDLKTLVEAIAAGKAPLALVKFNDTAANQMARALKSALEAPGVRAVCAKTAVTRTA